METETEYVLHSMPAINKGECVVVPKRHVENLRELSANELTSLIRTVQQVSVVLHSNLLPMGFTYGSDEGEYTGERDTHFKFHIIPRFMNDEQGNFFGKEKKMTEKQIQSMVTEIRSFFEK